MDGFPSFIAPLFDPATFVVSVVVNALVEVWDLVLIAWVLPGRKRKHFWSITLGTMLTLCLLKAVTSRQSMLLSLFTLAMQGIVPALCVKGGVAPRVIVCLYAPTAVTLSELVAVGFFVSASGLGMVGNEELLANWPVYLSSLLVGHVGAYFLLMALLKAILQKIFPGEYQKKAQLKSCTFTGRSVGDDHGVGRDGGSDNGAGSRDVGVSGGAIGDPDTDANAFTLAERRTEKPRRRLPDGSCSISQCPRLTSCCSRSS